MRQSEWKIIDAFVKSGSKTAKGLLLGPGDDCAIIRGDDDDCLISTDAFFEGIHFRRAFTDLATFGKKALSASVSDIVAMGGTPRFFTFSVGFPRKSAAADAAALSQGLSTMAHELKMVLIGGDTCRSRRDLMFSITVIGVVPHGRAILRSGARPGDAIYVSGPLGTSMLGLRSLEQGIDMPAARPFIARHRLPKLRLDTGVWLRKTGMVSSMIDVSDGLLSDLGHIASESHTGYTLRNENIPVEKGYEAMCKTLKLRAWEPKLCGGEDYELLFTVKASQVAAFEKLIPGVPASRIRRIGEIVVSPRVRTVADAVGKSMKLAKHGYDHFA